MQQLPKNVSGKILRVQLRNLECACVWIGLWRCAVLCSGERDLMDICRRPKRPHRRRDARV